MTLSHALLLRFAVVLLLWTLLAAAAFPQERAKVRVRISTDKQASDKRIPMALIRTTPRYFMTYRGWDGGFGVQAFQKTAAKLDVYDIDKLTYVRGQNPAENVGSKKLFIEDLVYFGGGPRLIGTVRETSQGEVHLYQTEVDPALTRNHAPYQKLCTFSNVKVRGDKVFIRAGDALREQFSIFIAPDTSHMLVVSPELRDEETNSAVYLMAMVDSDMTVLWQQMVDVDASVHRSKPMSATVDAEGNAYLLVKNNYKKRDVSKSEINFEMKLFHITHDGVTETRFGLGDADYVQSAVLRNLADGQVVCAGLYGNTSAKTNRTIGYFVAYVEPGSASLGGIQTFSYSGEDQELEEGSVNMEMVDLLPSSDGGYFLISEYFNIIYIRDEKGREYPRWVHGSVNVMRIDGDGSRSYSTKFARLHYSGSPILGNLYPLVHENELFIFMMDSDKLAEKRKDGARKLKKGDMKDPYSIYAYFDDEGGFRTKAVLRSGNNKDFISGWRLYDLGEGQYIATGTEKLISGRFLPVRIEVSR